MPVKWGFVSLFFCFWYYKGHYSQYISHFHTLFLRVADTGCGIPEADLPHIFEPFFTTKKAGAGTGLGLAIAAQVAEDHHGTIQVDSQVGSGTTFTVALPRFFSPEEQNSTKS